MGASIPRNHRVHFGPIYFAKLFIHLVSFRLVCVGANQSISNPRVPLSSRLNCQFGCPSPHGQTRGGELIVTIVEATNLPNLDGFGAGVSDPYVSVQIDSVTRTTLAVSQSLNPVWPSGTADLYFGAKVSGTPVTFTIWDQDSGLEFGDDVVAVGSSNVLDCSCFSNDYYENATCSKEECIEEAWVSLGASEDCSGRENWPWAAHADPSAACLRVRMRVVPFTVTVVEILEPNAQVEVGTASIGNPAGARVGPWGKPYLGNDILDPVASPFIGGLVLQTSVLDKDRDSAGTYFSFVANLDCQVYLFRRVNDYDNRLSWTEGDASPWQDSEYRLNLYGDDYIADPSLRYRAMVAEFTKGEKVSIGYNAAGMTTSPSAMFIVICVFKPFLQDELSLSDLRVFEKEKFFPILAELCFILVLFGTLLYPLMERLEYRFDRLEGFLVAMADRGKDRHLLAFVLKLTFNNGSRGNLDFRRNLFFTKCGMIVVLLTPVITFCSSAIILTVTVLPAAAGLAVFFVGLAVACAVWMKHASVHSGFRTSIWHLRLAAGIFLSLYLFLLCSSLSFLWDVNMPFSLFALTCISFTANMVPMTLILIIGDRQLAFAYARMQKIIEKNKRLGTIKGKFQALGTMGLKLAMLQASHQPEDADPAGPSSFGSLLGKMYTIDTHSQAFRYTDLIRQTFTKPDAERFRLMNKLYVISVLILLIYAVVASASPDPSLQGFGLSAAVVVLDCCVFLLRRGPTTFGTARFVFLSFAGRSCLCLFVGRTWVVGLSCAYFIYGVVLGEEIINQRMRTLSKEQAAAVAYYGRTEDPQNVDDVSASPEFVLGMLSGLFLLTLLSFFMGAADMPTVEIGPRAYGVWIFGVAAFVIVLIYVVLGLATRAVMLSKKEILRTKRYMFAQWFDLPLMLVSLAEVIVLMAGFALYVLTDGIVIFITALFVPPIFGIASKMYFQWRANDFAFFQPAKERIKEAEEEQQEDAQSGRKRRRRSSLRSLLKKPVLTDLTSLAKEHHIPVPLRPFGHQRIKKGQKATSKHWEENAAETDRKEESTATNESDDKVSNIASEHLPKLSEDVKPDKKEPVSKDDATENTAAANNNGTGDAVKPTQKEPAQPSTEEAGKSAKEPAPEEKEEKEPANEEIKPEEKEPVGGEIKPVGKSKEPVSGKRRAWTKKMHERVKRALKISDERDAVKMTVMEALVHGKLTAMDYQMLMSGCLLVTLLVVYGLILSFIMNSFLYGNLIWILSWFLLSSLVPFRKYYGTMSISPDMKWCLRMAILAECLAGLIVFISVLGASFSDNYLALILVLMGSWPSVLLLFGLVLKWKEIDWQTGPKWLRSRFISVFTFLLLNVLVVTTWLGIVPGAVCFLAWALAVCTWFLVFRWAENQFNLPIGLKRMVKLALYCIGVGCLLLSIFIETDTSSFLWISVGICAIELAHVVEICSLAGQIPDGMPLYFSTFVFPIYTFNPTSNDLVEQNTLGFCVFRALFLLFLWGACSIVMVEPLDLGMGLSCAAFLLLLGSTAFLVTRTPVWMGEAMLCLTEKEIKANAMQSRESFNDRRENLEISCDEYVLMDKQVQNRLTKFAKKAKAIAYETRYTSAELASAVHAAQSRLAGSRLSIRQAFAEAWRKGKGPLAPFALGGYPWFAFQLVRSITDKKAKYIDFGDGEDEMDDGKSRSNGDLLDQLIEVLGVGGDLLKVTLFAYDAKGREEALGRVEVALDELTPDVPHSAWYPLHPAKSKSKPKSNPESGVGELEIHLCLRDIWESLTLEVEVSAARDLPFLQSSPNPHPSDPFFIISCGAYRLTSQPSPFPVSPTEQWSPGAQVRLPPVDDRLLIEVKDHDMFGTSDALGQASILLSNVPAKKEHVQWVRLQGGHGKRRATGEVYVAFQLSGPVSEKGLEKSKAAVAVTVVKARGLRAADRNGLSDPFCVCSCGQDAFRTSVMRRTLEPVWEEEYTFNAAALTDDGGDNDEEEAEEHADAMSKQVKSGNVWKVYLSLGKLDRALSREFYEERRASVLLQLRLVVSSRGLLAKEAVSFQRFLREYRFKLLANGIDPPSKIFKSQSWATVDVHLVALWLLRLSPEQRQRFYQLKAKHAAELEQAEAMQLQEDEQIKSHAERLKEWLSAQDAQRMHATAGDTSVTDISAMQKKLQEIAEGKDCDEDGMFEDPEFQASKESISGIGNEDTVVGWKRAKEFNDRCELFKGGTDPDDIFQGVLNNGWFLSAVSVLAASGSVGDEEVDPLIDNLFISKELSSSGAYAVRLYKNSRWENVIIDDRFPALGEAYTETPSRGAACSYSKGFEEIWVCLLEKAYAKHYQGYASLENGYVDLALHALTGAMCDQIFVLAETQGSRKMSLWKKLVRFARDGFLMGCGTKSSYEQPGNDMGRTEMLSNGLLLGACYTVYQVVEIEGKKLLQLRNPPGEHSEWRGDWSDSSPLWTTRLRKRLNAESSGSVDEDMQDGTFWMSYDDFIVSFRNVYVCHYYHPEKWLKIHTKAQWSQTMHTAAGLPSQHNPNCKLEDNLQWVIQAPHPVDCHIRIRQINVAASSRPYPYSCLLLRSPVVSAYQAQRVSRINKQDIVEWTGNADRLREKHIYATLNPGCYILLVATYVGNEFGEVEVEFDLSSKRCKIAQLWPRDEAFFKQRPSLWQKMTRKLLGRSENIKLKLAIQTDGVLDKRFGPLEGGRTQRDTLKAVEEAGVTAEAIEGERRSNSIQLQSKAEAAAKEAGKESGEQITTQAQSAGSPMKKVNSDWVKQMDPNTGKFYYWNVKTNETTWIQPESFQDLNPQGASLSNEQTEEAKDWVKQYDPASGSYYYWNTATGETRWDEPIGFQEGNMSEELSAATKIQAQFRGNKSRKELLKSSEA